MNTLPRRPRSRPMVHGDLRGIWSRCLACTAHIQLVLNVKVHLRPPHATMAEGFRADDPWMRTMQCLQYLSLSFTGDRNSVGLQGSPPVHRSHAVTAHRPETHHPVALPPSAQLRAQDSTGSRRVKAAISISCIGGFVDTSSMKTFRVVHRQ